MGTNYYTEPKPPCDCCKRPYERLHIGKSSAGWTFHFASYFDLSLTTWRGWRHFLSQEGTQIVDEYGVKHDFARFVNLVESKQGNDKHGHDKTDPEGYSFSNGWDFS